MPVSVIEIRGSLGLSSGVSFLGLPLSFSPNQVISRTWPALPRLTLSQLEKVGTGILRVPKCPQITSFHPPSRPNGVLLSPVTNEEMQAPSREVTDSRSPSHM